MAEASNGQTELSDVLEDTFIRFCQFAYIGDYQTPVFSYHSKAEELNASSSGTSSQSSQIAGEASVWVTEDVENAVVEARGDPAIDVVPEEVVVDGWGDWGAKSKKSAKSHSKSNILRQQFNHKIYDITTIESRNKARCGIRGNERSEEDYTPIFLGHARLYVFAEKWGIDTLKALTLHKLQKTLILFKIYEARRGDVVELVKFAYSNENTPDLDDDVDALRELVVHYVTYQLESLIGAPEFLVLLEQPGPFSRDLVRMMMRRMD
jgi:hypothetical protein